MEKPLDLLRVDIPEISILAHEVVKELFQGPLIGTGRHIESYDPQYHFLVAEPWRFASVQVSPGGVIVQSSKKLDKRTCVKSHSYLVRSELSPTRVKPFKDLIYGIKRFR